VISSAVLRKAMHEIAAKKGDFTLFGLFKRADALGMWDLVVSAPWLESGKLNALGELVELLTQSLGKESISQFSRVETVPGNHPTVKYILNTIPVDDGERRLQNTDLFGLQITDAIILRAKRPVARKPTRKALQTAGGGSSRRRG